MSRGSGAGWAHSACLPTRAAATCFFASLLITIPSSAPGQAPTHVAPDLNPPPPVSAEYLDVQKRLAQGWNTWDVHSVATQVLLPQGLAIHIGFKHNSTLNGDAFLADTLIGRLDPGAEVVTPGPHSWDGSYTSADFEWKDHKWRVESAHDGDDLVVLIAPLKEVDRGLPPTFVISANFLWGRPGTVERVDDHLEARTGARIIPIFWAFEPNAKPAEEKAVSLPIGGALLATDESFVGISTGRHRTLDEIRSAIGQQASAYRQSIAAAAKNGPILDAIETTIGWDTIYDPEKQRVISPVSRVWSVGWGGYVLFDWDTFFAATLASIGDKDLAYANALEILREETPEGFVPNYARAGNWKSSDRSEPPVGALSVLGLYSQFHDRWFLRDAFAPLLSWNRWWAAHRTMQGFIVLGSDPENQPVNLDDTSRGTWQGAVYESGLDNSPMYDGSFYNPRTHLLEYADVGMTSLYIADCDALAQIAVALDKPVEAKELRDRAARYRVKLATLWDEKTGIFLNKDLHTGQLNPRLSPTNFYPMLARAATPAQARTMIQRHLLNPSEFWGQATIPSIAMNDPAFHDQDYWRGRIWGPMNYLVYLGLQEYDDSDARSAFAQRSYDLFLKEWRDKGHVHENYNAITGEGDDVKSSDRFYHWGALLGYVLYLEQTPNSQ
ncbi:MAG TPA: trehalase family glycosidase [Terracidiphilus sp.]|nr:trehalase family glycosidase [Terracidiphilus sp.]